MNTTELNRVLSDEIYKLRANKAKPERTNAIVRAASVIVAAARLELQHAKLIGHREKLPFFGDPKRPVIEGEVTNGRKRRALTSRAP